MYYYIKGTLVMTDPQTAVVDCGGVGYKLSVSQNTLSHLTKIGAEVLLYTHYYIREDTAELIGFYTEAELSAFKLLITVSGIGPKAAMAILSVMTPEKFALAVSSGDAKSISKAQGVGAKTAARVILELKDKIAKTFGVGFGEDGNDSSVSDDMGIVESKQEAVEALMVLGYTRQESKDALRDIDPTLPLEDMITKALRKMSLKF